MKTWRALAWDIAKIAIGLLATGFIALQVVQNWEAIEPLLGQLDLGLILFALLLQGTAFLLFPNPSLLILRRWQPQLSYIDGSHIFFVSQLTKYLPGSIWVFPSRALLMRQFGFSFRKGAYVLGFETLAFLTTGLTVSFITFGALPASFQPWAMPLGLAALAGIAAMLLLLMTPDRLVNLIPKRWRPTSKPEPADLRTAFGILIRTFAALGTGWVLNGASLLVLLSASGSPVTLEAMPILIATFALSWIAGFVIILSPGGVGVREGVFILLLTSSLTHPVAALLALMSRLIWWLSELIFYFIFAFTRPALALRLRQEPKSNSCIDR